MIDDEEWLAYQDEFVQEILAEYDEDNDGMLSQAEFLAHMQNDATYYDEEYDYEWDEEDQAEYEEAMINDVFATYDEDGDDKLSREEFSNFWFDPLDIEGEEGQDGSDQT